MFDRRKRERKRKKREKRTKKRKKKGCKEEREKACQSYMTNNEAFKK